MPFSTNDDLNRFSNLVDILRFRAESMADKTAYIFLENGETEKNRLTFRQLDQHARYVAYRLLSSGLRPGDRALLVYPAGLDYVVAFMGALYAGLIAVPVYPPHPARLSRTLPRLVGIIKNSNPAVIITTAKILKTSEFMVEMDPIFSNIKWLATDEDAGSVFSDIPDSGYKIAPDDLAFLQYTSGSTGNPKGVMVSHGNLIHNQKMIAQALGTFEDSVLVSWLPLYHDMGLIGNVLHTLYMGASCVLMSPVAFLQKPAAWLTAVTNYKGTVAGGPNFAFDLCVRKISEENMEKLDLRSWKVAFNGSEPVRQETLIRFKEKFKPCGFSEKSFFPCYGMAEATLVITSPDPHNGYVTLDIDNETLKDGIIVSPPKHKAQSSTHIGCGHNLIGQDIVIVDPDTFKRLPDDTVGEIWVHGPHVAKGYWNQEKLSDQIFKAEITNAKAGETDRQWLRTGDLGFFHEGELYISGRLKDVIIIRGKNHYPQDIELTVEKSYDRIRPGCVAAFSVDIEGEERLVIVAEVERRFSKKAMQANEEIKADERLWESRRQFKVYPEIIPDTDAGFELVQAVSAIRKSVSQQHQLQVYAIVFIKVGSIPKTTSGKIRRNACRSGFLDGTLETVTQWTMDDNGIPTEAPVITRSMIENNPPAERLNLMAGGIKEMVSTVLKVDIAEVVEAASLTELGIDSLMAVELQHRLEIQFNINFAITKFLEGITVGELISETLSRLESGRALKPASLEKAEMKTNDVPLSHNQKALWFLYRLAPESSAYNIFFPVKIVNTFDIDALKRALETLTRRHPSLRTTYHEKDALPVQQIHDHLPPDIQIVDASDWGDDQPDRQLEKAIQRPFDLENGPVMRVYLFKRSETNCVFVIGTHHIVIDLWSFSILLDELRQLYMKESGADGGKRFPEKSLYAYPDYVRYQQELLSSQQGEALLSYWRRQLSGELPDLDLQTDFQRPPVQTYNGASVSFTLDVELTRRIKTLGIGRQSTLYMILLAAFSVLLYRYTGQTDILTGSPMAGRTRPEFKDIIGYFVNSVVIRSDLSDHPRFCDFLSRVKETVLEALIYQDCPFSLLVEELQPKRDPSRSPIFQAMFVLEKPYRMVEAAPFVLKEEGARMNLGGLEMESITAKQRSAQFDLTLMMVESDGRLLGSFEYNTDLFKPETIERMAAHFQRLVQGIVDNPEYPVAEIPMLMDSEQTEILETLGRGKQTGYERVNIVELFERQAAKTPDRKAVIFGNEHLTYRELNAHANAVARFLKKECGVTPNEPVGLLLDRSHWVVVGMLGILKSGAVYTPVDPAYPEDRIRYMLNDCNCRITLTEDSFFPLLESLEKRPRIVDIRSIEDDDVSNLEFPISPDHLSYLLYTSGSTGQPKGVMQTHRTLTNLIQWQIDEMDGGYRILQYAALGFDVSIQETLYSLVSGGTLYVIDAELRYNMPSLAAFIIENGIELFTMPFSPLSLLFKGGEEIQTYDGLKHIVTSGEALQVFEELWDYLKRYPKVKLHNQYGPTETHVVTAHTMSAELENIVENAPIGIPVSNTQILILNDHYQPVPVGMKGEIYVEGANVAKGYLNRDDLTSARFIPHPVEPSKRVYRTGDVGRWRPDGVIEFFGRNDDQVKIRGNRVEPGEIETRLMQHPQVKSAVVIARKVRSDNKELVAYIIGRNGWREEDLRNYLKSMLPHYMIPSYFISLTRFPLSPNGKVNKKALPDPGIERALSETTLEAPRDAMEKAICEIWKSVLGIDRIGIRDNFFELGGHSLKAIQVISRIHRRFNVKIDLKDFFIHQTIEEFAAFVRSANQVNIEEISPVETVKPMGDEEAEILKRLMNETGKV